MRRRESTSPRPGGNYRFRRTPLNNKARRKCFSPVRRSISPSSKASSSGQHSNAVDAAELQQEIETLRTKAVLKEQTLKINADLVEKNKKLKEQVKSFHSKKKVDGDLKKRNRELIKQIEVLEAKTLSTEQGNENLNIMKVFKDVGTNTNDGCVVDGDPAYDDEIDQLKHVISNLEARKKELKANNSALKDKYKTAKEDAQKLDSSLQKMKITVKSMKEKEQKMQENQNAYEKEVSTLKGQVKDLVMKVGNARNGLEISQSQLESCEGTDSVNLLENVADSQPLELSKIDASTALSSDNESDVKDGRSPKGSGSKGQTAQVPGLVELDSMG